LALLWQETTAAADQLDRLSPVAVDHAWEMRPPRITHIPSIATRARLNDIGVANKFSRIRADYSKPRTDPITPRIDYSRPKMNTIRPRIDYFKPKMDTFRPRIDFSTPRVDHIRHQSAYLKAKTDPLCSVPKIHDSLLSRQPDLQRQLKGPDMHSLWQMRNIDTAANEAQKVLVNAAISQVRFPTAKIADKIAAIQG